MQEARVLVPEARLPEFYKAFGVWLAGNEAGEEAEVEAGMTVGTEVAPWGTTDDDLARAQIVWERLNEYAAAMFNVLMDSPGEKFSGEWLAEELKIEHGKYGVAGMLGWPGRYCYAVGRSLPVRYEDGAVGESAKYWMEPEVAALFVSARDAA